MTDQLVVSDAAVEAFMSSRDGTIRQRLEAAAPILLRDNRDRTRECEESSCSNRICDECYNDVDWIHEPSGEVVRIQWCSDCLCSTKLAAHRTKILRDAVGRLTTRQVDRFVAEWLELDGDMPEDFGYHPDHIIAAMLAALTEGADGEAS